MREKLFNLLTQVVDECGNSSCKECKYFGKDYCGSQRQADFLVENDVSILHPTEKDTKCTASLNFEAEYARSMEELEKAKYEIDYLRNELRNAKQALSWHEAMKQTIEVIFGRKFDNEKL